MTSTVFVLNVTQNSLPTFRQLIKKISYVPDNVLNDVSPYLLDAVFEGLRRQASGPLHGLAVIVGPPAGAVDVHMVGIEANRAGLNGVGHDPIQHPDTYTNTWIPELSVRHRR